MTIPLDPRAEVGPTEYSHGAGLRPHPDSNYQKGKLPFPEINDRDDDFWQSVADRRSDSTDESGAAGRDLLFEKGNPDRYGGQPAIVRVPVSNERSTIVNQTPKTKVERED